MAGRQWWYVVGCYIAPRDAPTIEDVAAAIRDQPYGSELLVAGDLNANLADPEVILQGKAIAYDLVASSLLDMGLHLLPQNKLWLQYRCTWRVRKYGQEVRSRTDYILGIYYRLFQDVDVRDLQHHSDHYMVLVCLRGDPTKELM